MAQGIVGVDIGTASIRAVELEDAAGSRPTIVRFGEVAVPDGATRAGEVLEPHTVAAALKKLWSSAGFKSKDIVLGIGNQRVLARDVTLPRATQAQIRESLPFQVQELLPVPVADAVLDFYPMAEDTAETGPVLHGLLIAATKDAVMNNILAARLAGLAAIDVDLIPFALTRVQRSANAMRGIVAVVDIGATTTSVIIAKDGVPQFVRIIPVGGDELTKAIAERGQIPPGVAEQHKRQLGMTGGSMPEYRSLVEVIYAVTGELLTGLRNTLSYYTSAHNGQPIGAILLTGGGSRLSGLAVALGEATRIPVTLANPLGGVQMARSAKKQANTEAIQSLTVALGLAIGATR
ncbi:type IV pilus assembly protein PilM [soil metagenome]